MKQNKIAKKAELSNATIAILIVLILVLFALAFAFAKFKTFKSILGI
ncbi:MAG: hypothetical protein ACOCXG_03845 [Nanoarchaeota archaeon]